MSRHSLGANPRQEAARAEQTADPRCWHGAGERGQMARKDSSPNPGALCSAHGHLTLLGTLANRGLEEPLDAPFTRWAKPASAELQQTAI